MAGRQLAAVQQLLERQEEENARLEAQLAAPEPFAQNSRALLAGSSNGQRRPASPGTIAALEADVAALEERLVRTARANAAEAMDVEMQLFEAQLDAGTAAGSERASLAPAPRPGVGAAGAGSRAERDGEGGAGLGQPRAPSFSTPLARARPSLPRAKAPASPIHPRTGSPRRPDSGVRLAPLGASET